jgi:glycosyltransferase involved in cell wall biosynthesis
MQVDFIIHFSNNPSQSPFAKALQQHGIAYRLWAQQLDSGYSQRLLMLCLGWPKRLWSAVRLAYRALRAQPLADYLVLPSHIELLAVQLLSRLLGIQSPQLLLLGFIDTTPRQRWLAACKRVYLRGLFRGTACVVSHSPQEAAAQQQHWGNGYTQFVYLPYGLHLALPTTLEPAPSDRPYAVSAGRSGRDYALLLAVFADLPYRLHIICDAHDALANQALPPNVTVLRQCYGDDYVRQLAHATLVIVPLATTDLSAGQMVLLQAMALRKPVIITDTDTTRHYLQAQHTAYCVPPHDAAALRQAIEQLWHTPSEAQRLADNGYQYYQDHYSMAAYVGHICDTVKRLSAESA